MTQHEKALALIAAEVANEGKVTAHAIRLYVENRISMADFRAAINRGMRCATNAIARATEMPEK